MKHVVFKDLGRMSYKDAWDFQEAKLLEKTTLKREGQADKIQNELFFVEHNPVYTLGKSGHEENVLISKENLEKRGIEYFHINRGGDITYHGPGQIVGYPIIDLEQFKTDLGWYLRSLEEVMILTLADYGLKGDRSPGETGVWLDPDKKGFERKICAMGIRCSRWVTMHGFAFNVNTDMHYFDFIIPCGIQGKRATSLQQELGHPVDMEEVKSRMKKHFAEVFQAELAEL
ncbi:lipoyl(octanoyl) transferase [Arachidicoccus rhizosphaerae]|uniref:Octanoyltransferase n=1 Tax=Arachidicoccus rhizosphaerae TaxID=551991 RepID=A0A1H3Y4F7_9BACT|nr:lipoyl(octanoyl) transferase LipB [Arachidicoccus rhizosphaerae]SEA06595.1 lipoyl(octanoyl) transferase [Arachidicoccus rhizosphaerae]